MLGEKYANINGQKLEENQNICIVSKYFPKDTYSLQNEK